MARDVKCFRHIGCVSSLGMGTWGMGGGYWAPDRSRDREWVGALRMGIELGLTIIDTAEMYGGGHAEELVGQAIRGFRRDELVIVTKVWPTNASYEGTLKAAKRSAARLGTYIDVYLLHAPSGVAPLCETVRAFEKLVDEGVIRFFGVSNFDVEGVEEARACCRRYDVVAVQNRYSLLSREDEASVIPYAQREGLLYMAYTPLEGGRLARDPYLARVGRKYGKSAAQVALNWLICVENVVPVVKAANPEHLAEDAGALGWRLAREDWAEVASKFGGPPAGLGTCWATDPQAAPQ